MFKKILLTIQALILVALFTACDDDTTGPDDNPKVNYLNAEIQTKTYNNFTLDEDNNRVDESMTVDTARNEGSQQKDGKEAYKYQFYNKQGSATKVRYYSQEENKLYINSEFFLENYGDVSSEYFELQELINIESPWLLIADAEAESEWELHSDEVTLTLPIVGEVDTDIKLTAMSAGEESIEIESAGVSRNSHIYDLSLSIIANISGEEVEINSITKIWVVPDFGVVRIVRQPFGFNYEIGFGEGIDESYEGEESVLVNFSPMESGNEN